MWDLFPFHPLHFIFCHSTRVARKVQKINKLTRDLVFGKMKGVNKEEAKRLSQLDKDRQKIVVEQNKEEEGIKMETKLENGRKRKIFSNGLS